MNILSQNYYLRLKINFLVYNLINLRQNARSQIEIRNLNSHIYILSVNNPDKYKVLSKGSFTKSNFGFDKQKGKVQRILCKGKVCVRQIESMTPTHHLQRVSSCSTNTKCYQKGSFAKRKFLFDNRKYNPKGFFVERSLWSTNWS